MGSEIERDRERSREVERESGDQTSRLLNKRTRTHRQTDRQTDTHTHTASFHPPEHLVVGARSRRALLQSLPLTLPASRMKQLRGRRSCRSPSKLHVHVCLHAPLSSPLVSLPPHHPLHTHDFVGLPLVYLNSGMRMTLSSSTTA